MTLHMQNVRCGYKGEAVVNSFSATVSSGDIFCLLGPNGVGKTTLFKCILGLLPLMAGKITVDGRDTGGLSAAEYAKIIAYVPQAHTPPFSFNVFDVVAMGRTAHLGLMGRLGQRDYAVAADCMERLGISHLAGRVYTELSGGERQMVLVARALAQEPAFLMMDEPTSNLDFGNQARVLQNVRMLAAQGLGIIMTTHQPDHVFLCEASVALMMRDNATLSGAANDVITEENLRRAYGINVAVLHAPHQGADLRLCQPRLDSIAPKRR
ncbi:MAG: ABC transporter ATP-binding protein [Ruminococcaceae bacterium]|nr:ABC transporter ATP-binding protein [Oscillospiraceae bacterium]